MTAATARATHYRWDDLPLEQLNPVLGRKLITGQRMMVAHVYLDSGCLVPKHQHHNEQISYVLKGRLKFLLGEDQQEEVIVAAGEVLVLPSHLPHSALALQDSLSIDLFSPPREDWLAGDDAYLRSGASS